MSNAILRERLRFAWFLLLLMILALASVSVANTSSSPRLDAEIKRPITDVQGSSNYIPHQLVVRLTSSTAAGSLSLPNEVLSVQAGLGHSPVYLLTLDSEVNESELANNLGQWGTVLWAHPNYIMANLHPIQGSYPFPDQNYIGSFDDQYSASMLDLPDAHTAATGNGTTVAIIDGGIKFSNPALDGKAASGFDFVDGDNDASDVAGGIATGHGTFVAGIVHLTAPDAQLKAYRVIDQYGNGDGFTLARAIEMAADDGCQVINLSLALTVRHLAVRDAIDYAASQGITIVAGAGNNGNDMLIYPAAEDNVIAVAAIDSTLTATSFTNFGSYIDICAPGENIYSTYFDPEFAWWSGTSFSSAFTSGLAALLKEDNPSAYGFQIRSKMETGATNLDSLNPQRAGTLGAGLINPVASMAGGLSADTALFYPGTMVFNDYECSQNIGVQNQTGLLVSTNAPAAYTATIVPSGGVTFVSLDAMTGFTNDSVRVNVSTNGLVAGTYQNDIVFDVEGIDNDVLLPVQLTINECNDSTVGAQLTPSELWFSATTGSEVVYFGSAMLTSTNAPAPFTAEIGPTPNLFVQLIDATGVTNDSVRVEVHPDWLFSAGEYTNTINYFVDGISTPASLVVHLTVSDSVSPGDDAWVLPESQSFYAPANTTQTQWGAITVGASGESKSFEVQVLDDPEFLELVSSTGMTPDSATFSVNITPALAPGLYMDTLVAYVTGAQNSPLYSVVTLLIDSTTTGGGDDASVLPAYLSFSAPGGIPTQSSGAFVVYATGGAKAFTVDYLDSPDFIELNQFSGTTPDSVTFDIVPVSTTPGIYFDTLMVTVADVTNSPLMVITSLSIDTVTSDTTAARSAVTLELWNYPNPFNPNTEIGFILPSAEQVRLDIFNILGQRMVTLIDRPLSAGEHSINWDANNAPSGIYYYRLRAGAYTETKKMLLIK